MAINLIRAGGAWDAGITNGYVLGSDGLPAWIDRRSGVLYFDDFLNENVVGHHVGQLNWVPVLFGTGATFNILPALDGSVGIWRMIATGNGSAARAVIRLTLSGISLASAKTYFEARVRFDDLSDGTNPFSCYVGLSDTQTAGDPANGVSFHYDQATNGDFWEAQVIGGSTETNLVFDGGGGRETAAVDADTWYRIGIVIDGDSQADFYVDGVLKGSISTNIPTTSEQVGVMVKFQKTTGSTAREIALDYVYFAQLLDTER